MYWELSNSDFSDSIAKLSEVNPGEGLSIQLYNMSHDSNNRKEHSNYKTTSSEMI